MRKNKYSMFWNWVRWQCLNKEDWNWGEIPKGTTIDVDQATMEFLKLIRSSLKK